MDKLYMTVGYPGGEFACWADNPSSAHHSLIEHFDYCIAGKYVKPDGDKWERYDSPTHPACLIRLAPPDLVEWVMAETDSFSYVADGSLIRRKVAGGWTYDYKCASSAGVLTFIPVAGAAGLTVIDATAEGESDAG